MKTIDIQRLSKYFNEGFDGTVESSGLVHVVLTHAMRKRDLLCINGPFTITGRGDGYDLCFPGKNPGERALYYLDKGEGEASIERHGSVLEVPVKVGVLNAMLSLGNLKEIKY